MRISTTFTTIALAALLPACGPANGSGHNNNAPDGGGTPDGGSAVVSIEVTPKNPTLTVVDGVVVRQDFTAIADMRDGSHKDVSAQAAWTSDEQNLGTFGGATFTAAGHEGGVGAVHAAFGGATGDASVTVNVKTHRVVSPAPTDAPTLFAGATDNPGQKPTIVYPSDKTVMPPNLGAYEVHWKDTTGNDLWEVALSGDHIDLRVYTVAQPDGTLWVPFDADEWSIVANSLRGGDVNTTVRGLVTASPKQAGTSDPITVHLEEQDVTGAIYYWASKSDDGSPEGIYRHGFGQVGKAAQEFYTTADLSGSGHKCVACHVLSQDGAHMAVTYDGGDGAATILDVATRMPVMAFPTTVHWNFGAFNPDATRLIGSYQGALTMYDAASGKSLATVLTPGYSTHVSWSPMGDKITYVVSPSATSDWKFTQGRIVVQPYDAGAGTFGTAKVLVPQGTENNYYPSFSPDGNWVAFDKSTEDAYDNASAELYVVKADGSVGPTRLSSPDVMGGLTNSWPRWAPFAEQTHGPNGVEPVFWLTFSSKRDFGVRLVGAGRPQIWMAPFYPDRAMAGKDPSAPAFRLPFQSIHSNNHIAQWTRKLVVVK